MALEEQDVTRDKTVLTYGTYDLFHIGHLRLFKRLRGLGNKLIVGVSTDEFNEKKGKKTIIPFDQRVEIVKSIRCVDLVIPEHDWSQKIGDIEEYDVDIFAMGDDWRGKFDELKAYCEVVYLTKTLGISSTQIKEALQKIYRLNPEEMNAQFDVLQQLLNDLK